MPDAASQGNNPDDRTPQDRPEERREVPPPAEAAGAAAVSDETGAATRPVVSPRREPASDGPASPAPVPQAPIPTSTPMISTAADTRVSEASSTDAPDDGASEDGAPDDGATDRATQLSDHAHPAVDSMLVDDVTHGSDLTVKVGEAWQDFARALATAISALPRAAHVDITLDPTATGTGTAIYEVSVQRHADDRLGALAVSNASLPEGARLSRDAVAEMIIIGWSPPGVVAGLRQGLRPDRHAAEAARIAVTSPRHCATCTEHRTRRSSRTRRTTRTRPRSRSSRWRAARVSSR